MKARCPKDSSHKRFWTTAHEVHDWVVDENGEYIEDLGRSEIAAEPDPDNLWRCNICDAEAIVSDEDDEDDEDEDGKA